MKHTLFIKQRRKCSLFWMKEYMLSNRQYCNLFFIFLGCENVWISFLELFHFFFSLFFICRIILILVTAKHLDYMDAALHVLGTLKKMQPCLVHQVLERSATKCPQQHIQKFRWNKTRRWYLEAPHYLAWSQKQSAVMTMTMTMTMTTTKTLVPLQLPTVLPPQRSSEKKQAVCEISTYLPPQCKIDILCISVI